MQLRFSGSSNLSTLMADATKRAGKMSQQVAWGSTCEAANDTRRRLSEVHNAINAQNKVLEAVVQKLDLIG